MFTYVHAYVCTYVATVDKPHISDVILQEAPTNAKLLEHTTLDDENAQVTPLAELSEHDHMQWSHNTREDEQRQI